MPATASLMRNVSGRNLLLFSALAIADLSVLAAKRAPLRGTTASTATNESVAVSGLQYLSLAVRNKDVDAIVAFLKTLTDKAVLENTAFSSPAK